MSGYCDTGSANRGETRDHDERDHRCEDRPVDEEPRDHLAVPGRRRILSATGLCGRIDDRDGRAGPLSARPRKHALAVRESSAITATSATVRATRIGRTA